MSAPRNKTLIFCEMHYDPLGRELLAQNLNWFNQLGFNKFAFEFSPDVSLTTLIENYSDNVNAVEEIADNIINRKIPLKHADYNVKSVLGLGSTHILLKLLRRLNNSNFSYHGIDIKTDNRFGMSIEEQQKLKTPKAMKERNEHMAKQLIELGNGTLALIGVNHAVGVYDNLVKQLGIHVVSQNYCFVIPVSRLSDRDIDVRHKFLEAPKRYFPYVDLLGFALQRPMPKDDEIKRQFRNALFERGWRNDLQPREEQKSMNFFDCFKWFGLFAKEKELQEALDTYDKALTFFEKKFE